MIGVPSFSESWSCGAVGKYRGGLIRAGVKDIRAHVAATTNSLTRLSRGLQVLSHDRRQPGLVKPPLIICIRQQVPANRVSWVILSAAKDLAAAVFAAVMGFLGEQQQITRHKNTARDLSTPAASAQDDPRGRLGSKNSQTLSDDRKRKGALARPAVNSIQPTREAPR
jgi:hypothetical protein